ncbi:MAG: ribulose bisphosphate carboxylase small subunit [Leptolyngbyaceae cyanobacterium bins.59]|nr:ribulose bisphosphate carboxylase small subunit [Leptolyngbyaceae cyanobacterium bins.59]
MSYYISPRFLDKLAVHITKNFLTLPGVRVPLILGVHGRKGEGKSFQCELVFERMNVDVVHISGGELESPDAGDSARLVRLRYREAAEMIRTRGHMAVLMFNDLDAGAGRFDAGTQYTVNTQLVNATLMNIADNPTNVQLPGSYDETPLHRVPIIVTGNDFSTLYAPLIRDGRMEKFFWEPDRADKVGVVAGIFEPDGLSRSDVEQFVDTFPTQAIDFFSAVRARVYDEQIRQFIHEIGLDRIAQRLVNSQEGAPQFPKPDCRLSRLLEFGYQMEEEQKRIESLRLVQQYNYALKGNSGNAPAEQPAPVYPSSPVAFAPQPQPSRSNYSSNGGSGNGNQLRTRLTPEIIEQIRQLLAQGCKIAVEHVDQRRFRANSWQSCAIGSLTSEAEALAALESCLSDHAGEYVRFVGIDPKAKRRIQETIVQRP